MGGSLSSKFKEAMESEPREMTTPAKRIHRILGADFDPRSPTIGVDRTPIAISVSPLEDKHEGSKVEDVCETPKSEPPRPRMLDLDPRSPSDGIDRTPIHMKGPTVEHVVDPRSPTCDIPRTPIIAESNDEVLDSTTMLLLQKTKSDSVPDIDCIPPIVDIDLEEMNRSISEPDLNKDEILLLRHNNGSAPNSFRESTPKKKSERKTICQGFSHDDISCKTLQVKDRSPFRVRDTQRSPLSLRTNFDVNSPRNIVQRKQVNKLSQSIKGNKIPKNCGTQSPNRYQTLESNDKENLLEF